jgi:hypothetical protein
MAMTDRLRTSPATVHVGELLLIALYSFCVLYFFFDGDVEHSWRTVSPTPIGAATGICAIALWLLFLARFVVGILRSDTRREFTLEHLGLLCLLIAPVFTYAMWLPAIAVALIVLAFVLEIRRAPGDREWLTALAMLLFISALLTLAIVMVEDDTGSSRLGTLTAGYGWALSRLMRANIDDLADVEPVTSDGQDLAALLTICAALFATLLIGGIVRWLTKRERAAEAQTGDQVAALAVEVAELRSVIEDLRADIRRTSGSGDHT